MWVDFADDLSDLFAPARPGWERQTDLLYNRLVKKHYDNAQARGARRAELNKAKTCPHCGGDMPEQLNLKNTFCSKACAKTAKGRRYTLARRKHHGYTHCIDCGKALVGPRQPNKRFCGRTCQFRNWNARQRAVRG
jgi:hypothetical protein